MSQATEPVAKVKPVKSVGQIAISGSEQLGYHMEEFKALKKEVEKHLENLGANLRYAVIGSYAVITLLTTQKINDVMIGNLLPYKDFIWLVPLLISSSLAAFSLGFSHHISMIGKYLRILEDRISVDGLGWEKHFSNRKPIAGLTYHLSWILLLVANAFVALTGSKLMASDAAIWTSVIAVPSVWALSVWVLSYDGRRERTSNSN